MIPVEQFTGFFFSKDYKPSQKTIVGLAIFLGLLLANDIFGFSYHYSTDKKIDELQRLSNIINDPKADSTSKTYAISIRSDLMSRKTVFDFFLTQNAFGRERSGVPINQRTADYKKDMEDYFAFFLTSSGIIFIIGLALCLISLFQNRERSFITRVIISISQMMGILIICALLSYFMALIPMIGNTWIWNHLLNALIQLTLILFGFKNVINEIEAEKAAKKESL